MRLRFTALALAALALSLTAPVWASQMSAMDAAAPQVAADEIQPVADAPAEAQVTLEDLFQDGAMAPENKSHCGGTGAPSCVNYEGSTCSSEGGFSRCYDYVYCEWFVCFCTNGQWDCPNW